MFEKFDEGSMDVLSAARQECMRLRCEQIAPEHILLALTRDPYNIAARSLATMNINAENLQKELERVNKSLRGEQEPEFFAYESITLADQTKRIVERSNDFRLFFGREKIGPEHLLLALIDQNDDNALRILEELGANLTFLRRQVMNFAAKQESLSRFAPAAKITVISGISEMIAEHLQSMDTLQRLAEMAGMKPPKLPERAEVVLMVFLAYLPEFLLTQVAFQRYLVEETIKLLRQRTGPLEKETEATMVAAAAQNLRAEVRSIIEHLWTQEYRMLSQMPDEAEHEEIGSIIEDLWWTYSEELALHEVFDEALDDYRRKHVLNLQKRKLELAQRLTKLRQRLEDTLKQCFLKRTISA
jgi:hypothetical protein